MAAQTIYIDFETYSEAELKTVGAWAYAAHSSTAVLCMGYAANDDVPALWLPDDDLPHFATHPEQYTFSAWNSFFEYCIWHHVLRWPCVDVRSWTDTAAHSAACALPRALGACGAVLGIDQDQQKDKRGKYLIQRLCKPYRGERITDPDLLQEIYAYCKQDVIAERAIARKIPALSPSERIVWELDQEINIRGIKIDTKAVGNALVIIDQVTKQLCDEVTEITAGALSDVGKRQRVIDYVATHGYELKTYDKAYLKSVLTDDNLPPIPRRLIEIRQQLGKTSTAKYSRLVPIAANDGRAHGLLRYHGASTGRWSGQLFQPHNLPRSSFDDTDNCVRLFEFEDADTLRMIYDDPMEALSSCVRSMLIAAPGKRLLVADFASIEARVLAWLTGEAAIVDVFRTHGKLYEHTASQIYGVDIEAVDEEQRFVGKTAALALGYQGGSKAFQKMAKQFGTDISEVRAKHIVKQWRGVNPAIVRFWSNIERAAISATQGKGTTYTVQGIKFRASGDWLKCRLLSGRLLSFYHPKVVSGDYGSDQLQYEGTNSLTRAWEAQVTYGGRLTENIVSAIARDLLATAMVRLDNAGYDLVLSVHDEHIAEVNKAFGSLQDFIDIMCKLPAWAEGLPVSAKGFEAQRYRK